MKAVGSQGLVFTTGLLMSAMMAFALPSIGHAQTVMPTDDLSNTIRTAITSDPRSANMSKKQIDSMVMALTKQAQKQGVTSHDITWRPQQIPSVNTSATFTSSNDCGGMPSFVCRAENAFGVTGGNVWVLIGLGLLSGLIIIFIAEMLIVHHREHEHAA